MYMARTADAQSLNCLVPALCAPAGRFNERLVLSLASNPHCLIMDDELNVLPTSTLIRYGGFGTPPLQAWRFQGHSVLHQLELEPLSYTAGSRAVPKRNMRAGESAVLEPCVHNARASC